MSRKLSSNPIAVIGLGCCYPGSTSPQQLWENVLSRRRQFRQIPDCRMPLAEYYHEDIKMPDKSYGRQAAVIDGFEFNWSAHRIPKSTYEATDIVHWLALDTALKAVLDAGFNIDDFPGRRTGVIVGNTLTGEQTRSNSMRLRWPYIRKVFLAAAQQCKMPAGEMRRLEDALEQHYKSVFPAVNEDTLAGGLSNTIAGRICNYLNVDGGGYTVDGACSSSLLAITTAAAGLANGELDLALAGGVDVSLDPFELIGFSKSLALTPGDMTVYDRRGNGFIPGEGCGFVVLKRHDDALADRNYIYAVLHGWGISSDGGNVALTAPSASGQALAIKRAYAKAGYSIHDVDFIDGHGTGTAVGDRIELEAIAAAMDGRPVQNSSLRSCGISSLKSILGHTKAASGVGGFIKAVIGVNRRICPPTAGCRYPNPAFEKTAYGLYPIQHGKQYPPTETLRAGISSMGFGGINCHLTIASAGAPAPHLEPAVDERALMASAQTEELFVLSGSDNLDLSANCRKMSEIAGGISLAEMTDFAAYLANQGNAKHRLRAAFTAEKPEDLHRKLQKLQSLAADSDIEPGQQKRDLDEGVWIGHPTAPPRIGFLFPGQGSQQLGMAHLLIERFQWAREILHTVDNLCEQLQVEPLSQIIYPPIDRAKNAGQVDAWYRKLSLTQNAQPAICLASILWHRFLGDLGVVPAAAGGHSLGEATAFYAAGAFDESMLLRFAFMRGQAMTLPQSGKMLSLKCSRRLAGDLLERLTKGYAALANINSFDQMVVSGEAAAIDQLRQLAHSENISARLLPVSNAFHSRMMAPAADKMASTIVLPSALVNPKMQVYSGIDGQEIFAGHDLPAHFIHQLTAQVEFGKLAESITGSCDIIIEVGPGRVLSDLVNRESGCDHPVCMPVASSPFQTLDLNLLLAKLFVAGTEINWDKLYANRLVRPFVPADKKSFFINPCEKPLAGQNGNQPISQLPAGSHESSLLSNLAGLSPDTLNEYLNRRGGFLAEVIKADLKHSSADICPCSRKSGSEIQTETEISPPEKKALAKSAGGDDFYAMIEKATGFPRDTLTPDLRLLDDLNLDSIKSGDLIAGYAQTLGLSGQIDPAELANASLQEIIDLFERLREGLAAGGIEPGRFLYREGLQAIVQQLAGFIGMPEAEILTDVPVGPHFGIGAEQLEDILQAVSDQFHLNLNVDLDPLIGLSLNQIAAVVARVADTADSAADEANGELPRSWVREFKVSPVETDPIPIPADFGKRTEDKWPKAKVLILGPDLQDRICRALGQQLAERGANVHRAAYDSDGSIHISEGFREFSHFIVVLPCSSRKDPPSEKDIKSIIGRLSCAALPAPAASGRRRRGCLAFIQFGGGFFGTGSPAAGLHQCCTSALAKSVHLERHDLKVRVLDFDSRLAEKEIAEKAILEMQGPAKFGEVGYDRMLTRRTARAELLQPADYRSDNIAWSSDDVILVTGGAKGITCECALAVARNTGARMALVGRTPLSELKKDDLAGDRTADVLGRFEEFGLEARYYSCDVCKKDALHETLKQIRHDMGPITGFIHGAGLNVPRRIAQAAPGDAFREVSPKVIGALNILAELEQTPPRLIVGLTSVIGVSGMPGNSWYAFSNEALDLILRRFGADHPQTRTLSVAYSIWRDTGMGAKLGSVAALKRKGIDAIPNEEGIQRFVRLFRHDPGTHQVVITARMAHMDTLPMQPARSVDGARFLDRLIHHTPGTESVFAVHLSHAQDPYLRDHCFNGSYLFPTVFGLEAMAQVVAHVTGSTEFRSISVEDLQLQRPITVDPEDGADIVIYARIKECLAKQDPVRIKAGIFKPGVGAQSDYFSATFVLCPAENTAAHTLANRQAHLDIRPEDLYRHRLLFQGPRFQRIDRVHQLERRGDRSGTVLLSITAADVDPGEQAFANSKQRRLMLGDPFRRDALLQSAALLIPQDTSLPVSVKRWVIYQSSQPPSKPHRSYIQTSLADQKDQDVHTDVKLVDDNGGLIEKLEGYRLKIMQHHPDYPTVADLLQPDDHDTDELQKHLSRVASDFNLKLPEVLAGFLPGIHDLPREARRERERPLLERVVRKLAGEGPPLQLPYEISWQSSGKPVVASPEGLIEISVAHDRRYCIVSAADYSLGCDIERVTHRSYEQWVGILGPTPKLPIDEHMEAEALDLYCTGLWAAKEVLRKMDVRHVRNMSIEAQTENGTLLRCVADERQIKIVTVPVLLTRGIQRVLAVSAMDRDNRVRLSTDELPGVDYPGYEDLFGRQHYKIIEGGPQGQGIFVHRFPVTFQPAGQLSRHVYFSNYFFWAGKVREASAWPVLERISNQFATGKWGGVTNYAELKILGEATTHDLIEVWLWASGNGGPHNSVLDLTYDFRKVLPNGGHERLAWLEQQTTWVRIIENSVVKVEPYPDYYGLFLEDMLPRYDAPNIPQRIPEPLFDLHGDHDESYLYTSPSGPVVEPILHSEFIDTSLEDSNIVGNIYFANYYAWQGRVRDRFFYSIVPECFQGTGDAGELLCLYCRIDHLREGMPFDRIEVRMALKALQTSRATLSFEYFKVLPDGRLLKLAAGEQIVVWVRRDSNHKPVPHPFPSAVYQALREFYAHKLFKVANG